MSWFNKSSGDLNPDYIPNSSGQYALQHPSWPGHHGSVTCLKVTEDGGFLASGDAVREPPNWRRESRLRLRPPWVRREDEPGEILVFGTQTGLVVSLEADDRHPQSTIQIHEMDDKMKPHTVFSVGIKNFLPKAPGVGAAKGKPSGDYRFWVPRWDRCGRQFNPQWRRRAKWCTRAKSVGMIGSDHGVVYVFDRRTGAVTDHSTRRPNDWVQTVTATHVDGILPSSPPDLGIGAAATGLLFGGKSRRPVDAEAGVMSSCC
ncbi:hypothetical protein B0H11DRAFT_1910115 [Mycena galericulata]|nr:hypothetical protein B0H11DRAFT_1910115 [Mycena galericulata]